MQYIYTAGAMEAYANTNKAEKWRNDVKEFFFINAVMISKLLIQLTIIHMVRIIIKRMLRFLDLICEKLKTQT